MEKSASTPTGTLYPGESSRARSARFEREKTHRRRVTLGHLARKARQAPWYPAILSTHDDAGNDHIGGDSGIIPWMREPS